MQRWWLLFLVLAITSPASAGQVCLTLPDATQAQLVKNFTDAHGYQETIMDNVTGATVPNPETRGQFAKRIILEVFRQGVIAGQVQAAVKTAQDAAQAQANTDAGSVQ